MKRNYLWLLASLVLAVQLTGCKTKKVLSDSAQEGMALVSEAVIEVAPTNSSSEYTPGGDKVVGYNDEIVGSLGSSSTIVRKILYLPEETETQPQFPGGDAAYKKFLARNVKYPQEALKKKLQGSVKVGFTVNPDGSIVNAKVERKVNALLDNEALRVVKSMPRWSPGLCQGKPVPVKMSVPINFRLAVKKK